MQDNMNLKQLIGNDGHWQINKRIAKEFGIQAALLLQELVDLENTYFSGIEFYQTYPSITEKTGLSTSEIKSAAKILQDNGLVTKVNKKAKGSDKISAIAHWTLHKQTIINLFVDEPQKPVNEPNPVNEPTDPVDETQDPVDETQDLVDELPVAQVDKELIKDKELKKDKQINNTNIILDVSSTSEIVTKVIDKEEEAKAKIFFKLVDMYPKNKIGNRQHGLKKFKELDIKKAMTAIKNVDRYLKSVDEPKFVKSLLNYLDQECWSEEYLKLEETKNKPKDITNTKEFDTNY